MALRSGRGNVGKNEEIRRRSDYRVGVFTNPGRVSQRSAFCGRVNRLHDEGYEHRSGGEKGQGPGGARGVGGPGGRRRNVLPIDQIKSYRSSRESRPPQTELVG